MEGPADRSGQRSLKCLRQWIRLHWKGQLSLTSKQQAASSSTRATPPLQERSTTHYLSNWTSMHMFTTLGLVHKMMHGSRIGQSNLVYPCPIIERKSINSKVYQLIHYPSIYEAQLALASNTAKALLPHGCQTRQALRYSGAFQADLEAHSHYQQHH